MNHRQGAAATTLIAMLAWVVPAVALPIAHHSQLGLFAPDLGASITFSVVGAFLLVRVAAPAVAAIMCVQGVAAGLTVVTGVLKARAALDGPLRGAALWVAWLNDIVWVPVVALLVPLLLVFPDGRLPGRPWRWPVHVMAVLASAFMIVPAILRQGLVGTEPYSFAPNPTGFVHNGPALDVLGGVASAGLLLTIAVSLDRVIVRRRRATGVERAQYTSLFYGAAVSVVFIATVTYGPEYGDLVFVVELFAVAPVAVAVAVAVLRYRLYEIDRIVSRTVSYLVITGLLLGTYVGIVAAFSTVLPRNPLVVAGATLFVVALFVPVRRAVQRRVDRRFNRARYDRVVLVDSFAEQVRHDVTHGSDGADLLTVVHRALQPTHAGLWLVPR